MDYEQVLAREAVLQSILMINDNLISHMALYLTILFAYIAVAYVAGTKLSRLQLGLTTFIFVLASGYEIMNIMLFSTANSVKLGQLAEFGGPIPESPTGTETVAILLTTIVWASGAIAALIFMWSIRHSKTE